MKLLFAEDERSLSEAVVDILSYHNYLVDAVYNGEDALAYAQNDKYDGIILDIMMPGMDGIEVLKQLRKEGCKIPILLLTAKADVEDRIRGLDAGADDYLPKPFAMGELLARIRAMLRRREEFTPSVLTCGNTKLNQQTYELEGDGGTTLLSKIEYRLMELFMLNQGTYLSVDHIFAKVWGYDSETEINTVWVYISYLRKRLKAVNADIEIKAKRNIGYTLWRK